MSARAARLSGAASRGGVAAIGGLLVAAAQLAGGVPIAAAQAPAWRWESPRPQGNTLRAACADTDGAVWAAGELGTLGRLSEDLGSFDASPVRGTADLFRVACCPGGVIAVGVAGAVVRREPSGRVGEQVLGAAAGSDVPALTGVACVGERGVVVSSAARELWVSEDAGATFARRAAPHELFGVHAVEGALVASGPAGSIARSTDLGRTWTSTSTGVVGNLVAFAGGARDLIAVGTRGVAVRSGDGGATWAAVETGVMDDLLAVAVSPRGETIAVGAANVALVARGGGAFARLGALPGRFHGLVSTARGLVAVGMGGRIATRRGRGAFVIAPRFERSMYGLWSDARTVLVVGDHGFVARGAAGGDLRAVRVPTAGALHSVTADAAGVALAVGAGGVILRSTDRGARWRRVPVPATRTFVSVWMDDAGHAVCAGENGQRYRSDDGGRSWESISLADDVQVTGLASQGSTLWMTASGGRLERSEDFGRTWAAAPSPVAGGDLRTPFVTARGTLLVTVRAGTIARRDEAGRWSVVALRPGVLFSGLSGDASRLVLVAADGTTYVSRDDGVRWIEERPVAREVLTSAWVGPDGRAYATGYWGTLLVRP